MTRTTMTANTITTTTPAGVREITITHLITTFNKDLRCRCKDRVPVPVVSAVPVVGDEATRSITMNW